MVPDATKAMKTARTLMIVVLAFGTVFLAGCGKKRPPVAPQQIPLPVVTDLQATVDGQTVTLTWRIPRRDGRPDPMVAGFFLYRAKIALAEADCVDCPVPFKRLADMAVSAAAPKEADAPEMTYTETLEKGFRYIYKVAIYTTEKAVGPDSNLADLIH